MTTILRSTNCILVIGLLCGCSGCGADISKFARMVAVIPKQGKLLQEARQADENKANLFRLNRTYTVASSPFAEFRNLLYTERNFEAIQRQAKKLLAQPRNCQADVTLLDFYKELFELRKDFSSAEMLKTLDAWVDVDPETHLPHLLRGNILIAMAWEIRGNKVASEVAADRWPQFHERLELADKSLTVARHLCSNDPTVPATHISVAMGLGFEKAEMETLFQQVMAISPYHRSAYIRKIQFLMPKWHGSVQDVARITKQCELAAEHDPFLVPAVAFGHEELCRLSGKKNRRDYYDTDSIWTRVESLYRRALSSSQNDLSLKVSFATSAYEAEKYDVAHEMFEAIGDNWAWSPLNESLTEFNRIRVRTLEHIGYSAMERGDFQAAISIFEKAVRLKPKNAYAHVQLSTIYGREFQDLRRCKQHALEALASNPTEEMRTMANVNLQIVREHEANSTNR